MPRQPTLRIPLGAFALFLAFGCGRSDQPDRGDTGLGGAGGVPSTDVRPADSVRADSALTDTSRAGPAGAAGANRDTLASAPLAVSSIMLGSSLTEEKLVSSPKTVFAPQDTFYVSVSTTGVSKGSEMAARWIYEGGEGEGRTLHESSETIPEGQNAVAEFHISRGTPWPKGRYTVRLLLDGETVGERAFSVQ